MNTDIITTHFEYHSIDHNLLKLDILGHDDPTMIRRLEDLTGMDATTIPLDDSEVMSLFHSTDILGITPEDIGGIAVEISAFPSSINVCAFPSHTKKDQDTIRDGRIAQEMYARGFEFMPIDIYKAKARECQIIDGKIMPPLSSVEGLGDKACEQVEEAAKHGPFTSLENFRNQAKVSKTNVDKMVELGILTGLPETDQLTFDFFMAQSQV